ncbi:MAG: phosphonate C-P lyase system protein PhnG [Pseudomonadales bacterium]|nr:phosphonate C-P lyase system protein PhnG [Pseudomonadales bacterium]
MNEVDRECWLSALTRVPAQDLKTLVETFPSDWIIRPTAVPQVGLGMLKLRDSTMGEAFYLGEFPLSQCRVSVTTAEGLMAEGGALVMDDSAERVEYLALCDAVLAGRLPGWERVLDLVEMGVQLQLETELERKSILAQTRVDFSLLDADAGSDND